MIHGIEPDGSNSSPELSLLAFRAGTASPGFAYRDQVKADAKDAKSQQRTSSRDTRASLADALADLQDADADEVSA